MSFKNSSPIPCKVILVGDISVGKTSIINTLLDKNEIVMSTLGNYFEEKQLVIDDYNINFIIYDTAGQETYRALNKLFFNEARICLIIYDITRKNTFESVKDYWVDTVKEKCPENSIIGIIGNKSDLFLQEQVKEEEGKKYAKNVHAFYRYCSAQNKNQIKELFDSVGKLFVKSKYFEKIKNDYMEGGEKKNDDKRTITKSDFRDSVVKIKKKKCCK